MSAPGLNCFRFVFKPPEILVSEESFFFHYLCLVNVTTEKCEECTENVTSCTFNIAERRLYMHVVIQCTLENKSDNMVNMFSANLWDE